MHRLSRWTEITLLNQVNIFFRPFVVWLLVSSILRKMSFAKNKDKEDVRPESAVESEFSLGKNSWLRRCNKIPNMTCERIILGKNASMWCCSLWKASLVKEKRKRIYFRCLYGYYTVTRMSHPRRILWTISSPWLVHHTHIDRSARVGAHICHKEPYLRGIHHSKSNIAQLYDTHDYPRQESARSKNHISSKGRNRGGTVN